MIDYVLVEKTGTGLAAHLRQLRGEGLSYARIARRITSLTEGLSRSPGSTIAYWLRVMT
jgi:hypothetical protein